jgi:uncharacterized membrane protein YgcG
MTTSMRVLAIVGVLGVSHAACNIHGNTINATANIPNAMLSLVTDTDVNNVTPAQAVPMTVSVQNVYLLDPSATVPAGHETDAGYLEFHLDDETTMPLLVTAQTNVSVTIPPATPPGPHKIICRVHKHDGEATMTEFELDIVVKATVTTTTTTTGSGGAGGAGGASGVAGAGGASGGAGVDAGTAGADGGMTATTTMTVEVDASVMGTISN